MFAWFLVSLTVAHTLGVPFIRVLAGADKARPRKALQLLTGRRAGFNLSEKMAACDSLHVLWKEPNTTRFTPGVGFKSGTPPLALRSLSKQSKTPHQLAMF